MPYDPDADPDDLDDLDDLDESLPTLDQFLNDPGNIAMWERMGAAFRGQPAAEQIADLSQQLPAAAERRDALAALLADAPGDDPRRAVLAACIDEVDRLADRLAELIGSAPDHP